MNPTTRRRLENLAARTGCASVDELLDSITARPELLDVIAAALVEPIPALPEPWEFYRLAPPHPVSSQIAKITVSGNDLIRVWSEWNQTLIDTVKGLRYRWDESYGFWGRQITKLSAPLADRLVELGVHLLAAGLIIEAPSQELAQRITAADYRPERRHWVAVSKLDRYEGWFYIFWPATERFRDAVQRLTGARLFHSSAVVPATSFDEVLDFADGHGFAVSDRALDLAAKAEAERAAMFIANPQIVSPSPPLSSSPHLPIPASEPAGIPDELADDPL